MNAIDGTEHYERTTEGPPPSLLVIVLDTNPHAWAELSSTLSLPKAVANLLVFINAHLAFSHTNRVAVIASHCQQTKWLYPTSTSESNLDASTERGKVKAGTSLSDANKYRPFALIEEEVMHNLRQLLSSTTPEDLASTNTTMISGALTLALSYINRLTLAHAPAQTPSNAGTNPVPVDTSATSSQPQALLNSRILIVSTSGDLAAQYIPIMNLIFAAQHSRTPIDILKLAGDSVLLQQASHTTNGIFTTIASLPGNTTISTAISPTKAKTSVPISILPTLLFAYLPDAHARAHLIPATSTHIDFRAACFCHGRVVDLGYVCSICLSIFCEDAMPLPDGGMCLTCGTKLKVGDVTARGLVEKGRRNKRGVGTKASKLGETGAAGAE